MTTKDGFISVKDKDHFIQETKSSFDSDPQYNNLNINQNRECSDSNFVSNKEVLNNKNNGHRNYQYFKPQQKLNALNDGKSSVMVSSNHDYNKKEGKKSWRYFKKESSIYNSTLSLHIAAYENSVEASDYDIHGLKSSESGGSGKEDVKNLYTDNSSTVYQNLFELPRQQENQITEPSVMQFKSSQKMIYFRKDPPKKGQPKKGVSKEVRDEIQSFLRRTAIVHPNYPPPPPPVQTNEHALKVTGRMASRGQLVMEDMLKEVQNLVDGLKSKNEVAEWCLAQGNVVTDKLAVMKEYNQEVGLVNTFHAPEGRANLVASLQHESRQIQALQEENRQLEYAIEEMEHGMEMMMARHREIILNCRRSDKMMDLLAKLQITPTPSNMEKTVEMAKLLQECIDEHVEENTKHLEEFARLKTENSVLRILLHASSAENLKIDTVIDKLKDGTIPDDLISKYFSGKKVDSDQEESSKDIEAAESSNNESTQSTEISSKSNIPIPKSSKSTVSKAKVQAADTSKN